MNLYVSTLTFFGFAESADEFSEQLLNALEGDADAQKVIHATTAPVVVKLGRCERESDA